MCFHLHLCDLLEDKDRCEALLIDDTGTDLIADFTRQRVDEGAMLEISQLAEESFLDAKVDAMFRGERINVTEDRAVLHTALRAPKCAIVEVDGRNVVEDVHDVLDKIEVFSNSVRSGRIRGATGKLLSQILVVGIGGSALGTEFVYEALRVMYPTQVAGRTLRILANIDPVDVARATEGLDAETTLVIICSKTFTTAETMMNARTAKEWLTAKMPNLDLTNHLAAVSTNLKLTSEFGIRKDSVFGFWDWVGGRFSVTSAVGLLPLSLVFSYDVLSDFLEGARSMDNHFRTAPLEKNIPKLMGLIAHHNVRAFGYNACAVLPYSQSLCRFPAHIQQLCMESNGKRVTHEGDATDNTGEIFFGEPGTSGQHSFFQLLHQGRVIPADFIGFMKSQNPVHNLSDATSNHDELMCNFFAQPDALALGKTPAELEEEGVPKEMIPHKTFPGNRPSTVLLFRGALDAKKCGVLLALYEHRTAVQGFLLNVNSFDQWGVELGKVLAKQVRAAMIDGTTDTMKKANKSTRTLLGKYLTGRLSEP